MRAENRHRTRRDLIDVLDEAHTLGLQGLHDVAIVDDLVTNVDRRAELFQGAFDNLDGTHHSRAKAARFCKEHLHVCLTCVAWESNGA